MNNRRFRVYGSLVRAKGRSGEQNLVATTYWVENCKLGSSRRESFLLFMARSLIP